MWWSLASQRAQLRHRIPNTYSMDSIEYELGYKWKACEQYETARNLGGNISDEGVLFLEGLPEMKGVKLRALEVINASYTRFIWPDNGPAVWWCVVLHQQR